jgi:type I restriction enzyme S subunit
MSDIANKPNGWELVRLADHTTVKARLGWKGLKAEEYIEEGFIFLATPNLKANQIDFENVNYITQWRYDESPEIQLRVGDVLIVKDGSTLGISNYVRRLPRPTTVNGSIAVMRTRSSLQSEFLYHLVNGDAFQKLIELKKAGLGVPHLFQADLREFFVSLPSLPQQRKIARILTTVDSLIERTEALIAKYQAIKQGMMHDLFTRGVDEHGHLRPPYEEAPELYKQSDLGWIPKEWEVRLIDSLAIRVGSGITPTGGSEVYLTEGVIFVRSQNVMFEGLDLSDVAYIDNTTHRLMAGSELFEFDVLLNITGASIGRCCYLPSGLGPTNSNQHVCCIRLPDANKPDAKFLSSVLSSPIGQNQIFRLNAGGNREGLNYQQLRSFVVPWPSDAERNRIAKRLVAIENQLSNEETLLAKLSLHKSGLMQDLLTGKVRVKVDEADEVAAHA